MSAANLAKIRARALADPYFFTEHVLNLEFDWYHRAGLRLAYEQPFSMFEMWRGGGKSTIRTTAFALYQIVTNPNTRGLILSETEAQAERLLTGIRTRLEDEKGILTQLFGKFVTKSSWTKTKISIAQRDATWDEPTVWAMGIDGPMTGGHWDWIILDDIFDIKSAFSELLRERLMDVIRSKIGPCLLDRARVIVNATRYHYDDAAGQIERMYALDARTGEDHVYRLEHPDDAAAIFGRMPRSANWKVIVIPAERRDGEATCPTRFPIEDRINPDGSITLGLRSRRRPGDPHAERAYQEQYMLICREMVKGEQETEFRRAWFHRWDLQPDRARLEVFQFVDPAFRDREEAARRTKRDREPDFYAIAVIGFDRARGVAYVLDAFRDRLTPLERETRAKEHADRWKPRLVGVERTGLQIKEAPEFYASILKALSPHRARFVAPASKGNKVARAQPLARAMNAGRVLWSPAILERFPGLIDEFAAFPFGAHDDLVDAVSGAFLLGNRREMNLGSYAWQNDRSGGDETDDRERRAGRAAETAQEDERAVGARSSVSDYDDRAC